MVTTCSPSTSLRLARLSATNSMFARSQSNGTGKNDLFLLAAERLFGVGMGGMDADLRDRIERRQRRRGSP